ITTFMRGSLSENFFGCGENVLDFEAELFEQIFQRGGRSERTHADDFSFGADVAIPSENGFHFDRDAGGHAGGQNAFLIGGVLLFEKLPAGHADDTGFYAFGGQLFISCNAEADFASAGEQDDIRLSAWGVGEDVGTLDDT